MKEAVEINNIGVRHFLNEEFEEAEKQYKKALEINPESATVLNNLGLLYHQKKKYKTAAEYFRKALKFEEKDTYCVNAGNAMANLNEAEKAKEWYLKALDLNAESITARESMANLLEYTGDSVKAAQYWGELINLTQKGKYFIEYAKNLIKRGKFKDALHILYNKAPQDSGSTWYLIGICEYELRNFGLTEKALKRSLGINPDSEEVRHYLAVALLASGRVNDAIAEIDKVLKLNPENYRMLTEKGVIMLSQKNTHEALNLFDKSLSLKPGYKKAIKYRNMALKLIQESGNNE